MEPNGYIQIHRKILNWEWYDDVNTFRVFFHLLVNANHKHARVHGIAIDRGQWLTSRKKLSKELKLSERQVRTALTHLKTTNELTIETTNSYTLVTIVNYDKYQTPKEETTNKKTNQKTNKRPTTDQRPTTNNNDNNNNKYNNNSMNITSLLNKDTLSIIPTELHESIKEFAEMRIRIKHPLTQNTLKRTLNRLQKLSGGDVKIANEILDNSIRNDWRDIYELKPKKAKGETKKRNEFLDEIARGDYD